MRRMAIAVVLLLIASGCSGDSPEPSPEPTAVNTPTNDATIDASQTPTPEVAEDFDPIELVRALSSDELGGRNNQTDGSARARALVLDVLRVIAEPATAGLSGDRGYLQPYDEGTNVLGLIRGAGTLADEYVVIGAHYDHLGPGECDAVAAEPGDLICNGAADNAAGVAAVLAIATDLHRSVATDLETDRRSVLLAFWDGEEDGFTGSRHYLAHPPIPLKEATVYVNFDIQGSAIAPELASVSFLVGAETGGAPLRRVVDEVVAGATLDLAVLSRVFGRGRSDHRVFAEASIPIVFFTDAPNGCYHSVLDDFAHLDAPKLLEQIAVSTRLVRELLVIEGVPRFTADLPLASYADAEVFARLVRRALEAASVFDGDARMRVQAAAVQLDAIVAAGEAAFDATAVVTLLAVSAATTDELANLECSVPGQ